MQLTARTFEVADIEAAVEFCYQQGWTDGLPVIPPTQGAIERILGYLGRDARDVIGVIPPRSGLATLEKIAINCVMAGCRPEYVPIVIAAIEAMLEEGFNLNGVQTTTNSCAPLVMVSGPAVKALGFNTRDCAFGHGSRANAAIGRAVRLVLWNIGGGYPGNPCRTTFGHPGYWTFCIAEDQDNNPWEPLQVTRGFKAEDTVVTVAAVDAPHSIATGALLNPPDLVLEIMAEAIARLGNNNLLGGDMVLVLGPMAAQCLAKAGLNKKDVQREIRKRATRPVREIKRHRFIEHLPPDELNKLMVLGEDAPFPFVRREENLVILTAGSWGAVGGYAALCPGWGPFGGRTQSKFVHFPDA